MTSHSTSPDRRAEPLARVAVTQSARPAAPDETSSSRDRPGRPALSTSNSAPVAVSVPPPGSVRFAQLLWVLSFMVGGATLVYYFIIRRDQLPLIVRAVQGVDGARTDQTYQTAADIIFWIAFTIMVSLLLIQITLLVSFMSRRPGVRWWQLGSFAVQSLLYLVAMQLVAVGEHGALLRPGLSIQCGLVLLALLVSTLPSAIAWTSRRQDVRSVGSSGPNDL